MDKAEFHNLETSRACMAACRHSTLQSTKRASFRCWTKLTDSKITRRFLFHFQSAGVAAPSPTSNDAIPERHATAATAAHNPSTDLVDTRAEAAFRALDLTEILGLGIVDRSSSGEEHRQARHAQSEVEDEVMLASVSGLCFNVPKVVLRSTPSQARACAWANAEAYGARIRDRVLRLLSAEGSAVDGRSRGERSARFEKGQDDEVEGGSSSMGEGKGCRGEVGLRGGCTDEVHLRAAGAEELQHMLQRQAVVSNAMRGKSSGKARRDEREREKREKERERFDKKAHARIRAAMHKAGLDDAGFRR